MNRKTLSGSSSWLAIVGASLFWVWMDRSMFGDSLCFTLTELTQGDLSALSSLAQSLFIVMLISNALSLLIFLVPQVSAHASLWMPKIVIAAGCTGAVGNLLIAFTAGSLIYAPSIAGAVISGIATTLLTIAWGRICIAQGPTKAMTHIAGAWALGLIFNILIEGLAPLPEGTFIALLPLLSAVVYVINARLQNNETYHVSEQNSSQNVIAPAKKTLFGIDVRFTLYILAFCILFGLMYRFQVFNTADTEPSIIIDLVGLRGIVALIFFAVSITKLARHTEVMFNTCLSFMIFGAVTMTVGVYIDSPQNLTRIFIPIGYAGFDILVWTLIAFYGKTTRVPPVQIIALAIGVEQVGILIGQVIGMQVIDTVFTENNVTFMVLSYVLVLAVLGLIRLGSVLWEQQRSGANAAYDAAFPHKNTATPIQAPTDEGEETLAPHLAQFADTYGLTPREREVFALFSEGRSARYIAEMLFLSENTVKSHIRHIYSKSDLHNRQELLDTIEAFKQ